MKSIFVFLFAAVITVVTARDFKVDDPPIEEVHVSYGENDHERVTYIRAVIRNEHINERGRNDFPKNGYLDKYFKEGAVKGDERGHLVGSQFSGSAEWYNLSPQNSRVNRNEGYRSITTDWYGTECEVRRFLEAGGDPSVKWEVTMSYEGKSNRPSNYHLQVTFYKGGKQVDAIDTQIRNPTKGQDSTFWMCRLCGASRHANDEIRQGKGCTRAQD